MDSLQQAVGLSHEGRIDDALAMFHRLRDDPEWGNGALGHRAWILKCQGRYAEALEDYEELLRRLPGAPEAVRQYADTLRLLGRTTEALPLAVELLVADPMDQMAGAILVSCQSQRPGKAAWRPGDSPVPVRPLNPVIEALENDPTGYPASCFPEVGRMLYIITRCLRPSVVVETGSFIGYSTLCMAQALEENGGGYIHAFDLFPPGNSYESPVLGHCDDRFVAARGHAEQAGLAHRITFHRGDSSAVMSAFFHDFDGQVDMAFIDGDHSVQGCMKDFHVVDTRLRPGGIVLLHDTMPDGCGHYGPRYLLDHLPVRARELYQGINLPSPEGFGIGILQKAGGGVAEPWRASPWDLLRHWLLWKSHNPE